jgi:hypothetical protein
VGGKLDGRAAIAATAQAGRPGRLGVLMDTTASVVYLIDTGAVYSVIPYSSTQPATGPAKTSADGTPIPCWGWRTVTVTVLEGMPVRHGVGEARAMGTARTEGSSEGGLQCISSRGGLWRAACDSASIAGQNRITSTAAAANITKSTGSC